MDPFLFHFGIKIDISRSLVNSRSQKKEHLVNICYLYSSHQNRVIAIDHKKMEELT